MRINKNYDMEIDLRDLFFELLYKWRSLVAAALIGAILLAGLQYYSVSSTHAQGKQTKEEKQFEIDLENYRDSVKNAQNNIRTYNKLIKEKNDYLEQSVYMTLDSQNVWSAAKRFYIKMDQSVLDALPQGIQEDPADYVASVYTSTLKTSLDEAEMEALLGTGKREYIDELVTIGSDNASNTITLRVYGPDEETVIGQLDYFVDRMETVCQPMAQEVGAHTLTLVGENVNARTDSNLSAKQDEINKQIAGWQKALKDQREELNELEGKKEPSAPGMHLVRYGVIGFLLGAILLAAIYLVKYVAAKKLRSGRELNDRFGVQVLGEYAHSRARRPGKGLDRLFEKWEFKHAVADPKVVEANLGALMTERFAGRKLLLTGTCAQQKLDALAGSLRGRMPGACEIAAKGDILVNADAITAVKDADAVILVEEKHASRIADIERAAELLIISEADVGGSIVL